MVKYTERWPQSCLYTVLTTVNECWRSVVNVVHKHVTKRVTGVSMTPAKAEWSQRELQDSRVITQSPLGLTRRFTSGKPNQHRFKMFDMTKLWFMFSGTNSLGVKGWTFSLNSTQTHFTAASVIKRHSKRALPLKAALNLDILNPKCEECCSSLTCHNISDLLSLKELNLDIRTLHKKAIWAQKSFSRKNQARAELESVLFLPRFCRLCRSNKQTIKPTKHTLLSSRSVFKTFHAHRSLINTTSKLIQSQTNMQLLFQTSQDSVLSCFTDVSPNIHVEKQSDPVKWTLGSFDLQTFNLYWVSLQNH